MVITYRRFGTDILSRNVVKKLPPKVRNVPEGRRYHVSLIEYCPAISSSFKLTNSATSRDGGFSALTAGLIRVFEESRNGTL